MCDDVLCRRDRSAEHHRLSRYTLRSIDTIIDIFICFVSFCFICSGEHHLQHYCSLYDRDSWRRPVRGGDAAGAGGGRCGGRGGAHRVSPSKGPVRRRGQRHRALAYSCLGSVPSYICQAVVSRWLPGITVRLARR
eukprot:3708340-Pyramimonas_sp.AAC.1